MENLRQRTKKEVEGASQFAIQRFCKDIVTVADLLEMALKSAKESASTNTTGGAGSLMAGLQMTLEELSKTFAKHGVTPIDPLHQKFDPSLHNALYEVPDASVAPGTIVMVQKKGYLLHHRVIRPADVGIARAPPSPSATTK
jgi:molecular chaperone GrpE